MGATAQPFRALSPKKRALSPDIPALSPEIRALSPKNRSLSSEPRPAAPRPEPPQHRGQRRSPVPPVGAALTMMEKTRATTLMGQTGQKQEKMASTR